LPELVTSGAEGTSPDERFPGLSPPNHVGRRLRNDELDPTRCSALVTSAEEELASRIADVDRLRGSDESVSPVSCLLARLNIALLLSLRTCGVSGLPELVTSGAEGTSPDERFPDLSPPSHVGRRLRNDALDPTRCSALPNLFGNSIV